MNAIVEFKSNLNQLIDKKELALPSNVKPEAFRNAAVVAVQDNPQILSCTQESVFKSIRTLAAAGLVPDGREAALVPFNTKENGQFVKKCQAMPMVFGLIKMVRRSGEVSDIRAHIVYQNEVEQGRFVYIVGDEERLEHEPILFGERGEPVACYAIARLKDGGIVREFMSAEDIDKVRRAGASQRVKGGGVSDKPIGIWKDWWSEMWKKTAIRRMTKRLDLSSEDMRRIMEDQEFEHMRDVSPEREKGGFAKKLEEVREPQKEKDPAPVDEAEVIPADEPDPHALEYGEGQVAAKDGKDLTDCPYEDATVEARDWIGGWNAVASKKIA